MPSFSGVVIALKSESALSHNTLQDYSPHTTFRGQFVKVGSLEQSWAAVVV